VPRLDVSSLVLRPRLLFVSAFHAVFVVVVAAAAAVVVVVAAAFVAAVAVVAI